MKFWQLHTYVPCFAHICTLHCTHMYPAHAHAHAHALFMLICALLIYTSCALLIQTSHALLMLMHTSALLIQTPCALLIQISHALLMLPFQVDELGVTEGFVNVLSRHTTTAISINEYETRLLDDIRQVRCVTCSMSHAHVSHATYHMLRITCSVSHHLAAMDK